MHVITYWKSWGKISIRKLVDTSSNFYMSRMQKDWKRQSKHDIWQRCSSRFHFSHTGNGCENTKLENQQQNPADSGKRRCQSGIKNRWNNQDFNIYNRNIIWLWLGGVKYIFIIRKRETNWQEKQAFHDNCRTIYLHIYSIARQFNHFGEVLVGICMHLNYTLILLLHLYMCKL